MGELEAASVKRLFGLFASILAPPPALSVSEFAEKERILSVENAAKSGRWINIPYQVEMQNAFDSEKMVIFMTATQIGKTELIKNILLKAMVYETGGTTFMLPSESVATDYSKAQLEPLVRDTPKLRTLIQPAKKDGNSQLYRKWPGGYLRLVGSNSADKLSSFPSPRLFCDELDRCSRVARNSAGVIEGSPVQLFLERSKNWPNRFALFTSTPTIQGVSAIHEWWLKSDQRIPLVPCPHCENKIFLDFLGVFNRPDWGKFVWIGKDTDEPQEPDTVVFECGKCHRSFDDTTRHAWLPKLSWHKQRPEAKIAGFHINAFYSPWTAWSELVEKYVSSGSSPLKRMTFWNTTGGWPFSFDAIKTPAWQEIASRKAEYKRHEVPNEVTVLLAGCDVQLDRLECSVWGFYKKQAYLITHEVFAGNTSNIDAECWEELDAFIHKTWSKINGYKIRIHRCAIDAHYNTNQVAHFARMRKRIIPVTGVDSNWQTDILPSRPMDIKKNGKYFRTGKRRWPIGVSVVKLDLYGRLKLSPDQSGNLPTEYMHFPSGMSDEYYKQLTGEVCKLEEDGKGDPKMVWERQYEAVEALDCAVYTLALYKICGLHLWADERWNQTPSLD